MTRMQAPKGTFDILPDACAEYQHLEAVCASVLERAGYRRIATPVFEETGLFERGVGDSTDIVSKEMYTFEDGGGRSLTLRPEGTAPVCRAYVEHGMHKQQQPVRLYYTGPFFRHENPQAGRYRQFHQVGAEALGSDSPALDAEAIIILAELLEAFGCDGLTLRLSSLGSPGGRAAYRDELSAYLDARRDRLAPEVASRIATNPLRAFDSPDPSTRAVMREAPLLLDRIDADDTEHFSEVKSILDAVGVEYQVDPSLVRGLDYYSRTVFEFTSDLLGAQSGVGGGGRYDGLVELLGGPPTPGIGWASGVERMILAAGGAKSDNSEHAGALIIPGGESDQGMASRLARDLRGKGLPARVEVTGRSEKAALKHAAKIGATAVVSLGPMGASVRMMESGETTENLGLEEVKALLGRNGLGAG